MGVCVGVSFCDDVDVFVEESEGAERDEEGEDISEELVHRRG